MKFDRAKAHAHTNTHELCIYSLNILSENYLSQINRGRNLFHRKTRKIPYCKYLHDGIYIGNLFLVFVVVIIIFIRFFVYRSILFGYTCGRYFTNMPHANIIVPLRIKRMQKKILKYLQCFHIMLANLTLIRCAYLKTALE